MKIPIDNEDNEVRVKLDALHNKSVSVTTESKLNGRSHYSESQLDPLPVLNEETSTDSQTSLIISDKSKNKSVRIDTRSDEKIIAGILKPEERIRVSKSSDKLLKIRNTSTAFSLD